MSIIGLKVKYLDALREFYSFTHNYERALRCADSVLAIKPTDDSAWLNRGLCLSKLNQNDPAIEAFRQSLLWEPNQYAALSNLAELFVSKKCLVDATGFYVQLLDVIATTFRAGHVQRTLLEGTSIRMIQIGARSEASRGFEELARVARNETKKALYRGIGFFLAGNIEDAVSTLQKIRSSQDRIAWLPSINWLLSMAGWVLFELKSLPYAADQLFPVRENDYTFISALVAYGNAMHYERHLDCALKVANDLLDNVPNCKSARRMVKVISRRRQRSEKSTAS